MYIRVSPFHPIYLSPSLPPLNLSLHPSLHVHLPLPLSPSLPHHLCFNSIRQMFIPIIKHASIQSEQSSQTREKTTNGPEIPRRSGSPAANTSDHWDEVNQVNATKDPRRRTGVRWNTD